MTIKQIYKKFTTQQDCILHLEKVRWNKLPKCPYCGSLKQTPVITENRHYCNNCYTSYSVLVGTFLENTKLELQKWFLAIDLFLNKSNEISSRNLAKEINVNKNTAYSMLIKLKKTMLTNKDFLFKIIDF